MSMDLYGIQNQNEYYTNHYLASVFEENAQDTLKRWREEASAAGERTPWQKLNAVANRYFTIRDQAARFRSNDQIKTHVDHLLQELLPALGYPYTETSEKTNPFCRRLLIDEKFPICARCRKAGVRIAKEGGKWALYIGGVVVMFFGKGILDSFKHDDSDD